eukprot:6469722-Amphidinium_carterae.1
MLGGCSDPTANVCGGGGGVYHALPAALQDSLWLRSCSPDVAITDADVRAHDERIAASHCASLSKLNDKLLKYRGISEMRRQDANINPRRQGCNQRLAFRRSASPHPLCVLDVIPELCDFCSLASLFVRSCCVASSVELSSCGVAY